MNIPDDLEPPRAVFAPNHRLSLRTKEYGEKHVRDVEILSIGWHADGSLPLHYLVFDPSAEEDQRIYWIRGDYVQQIRRA